MSASGLEPVNLTTETGRLIKYHSNFFYVDYQAETYTCSLKGLLKKSLKMTDDTILVGDFVELDSIDAVSKTARIASIQSRQNQSGRRCDIQANHAESTMRTAGPSR